MDPVEIKEGPDALRLDLGSLMLMPKRGLVACWRLRHAGDAPGHMMSSPDRYSAEEVRWIILIFYQCSLGDGGKDMWSRECQGDMVEQEVAKHGRLRQEAETIAQYCFMNDVPMTLRTEASRGKPDSVSGTTDQK